MKKFLKISELKNETLAILTFLALFLLSSFFLIYSENRKISSNEQNDWWVLYFENPKDVSADFTIKNGSMPGNFHWKIMMDKIEVDKGDVYLSKESLKTISVKTEDLKEKKVSISVVDSQGRSKEIYKIISNQ